MHSRSHGDKRRPLNDSFIRKLPSRAREHLRYLEVAEAIRSRLCPLFDARPGLALVCGGVLTLVRQASTDDPGEAESSTDTGTATSYQSYQKSEETIPLRLATDEELVLLKPADDDDDCVPAQPQPRKKKWEAAQTENDTSVAAGARTGTHDSRYCR